MKKKKGIFTAEWKKNAASSFKTVNMLSSCGNLQY
jgi:hypothetical protein